MEFAGENIKTLRMKVEVEMAKENMPQALAAESDLRKEKSTACFLLKSSRA